MLQLAFPREDASLGVTGSSQVRCCCRGRWKKVPGGEQSKIQRVPEALRLYQALSSLWPATVSCVCGILAAIEESDNGAFFFIFV